MSLWIHKTQFWKRSRTVFSHTPKKKLNFLQNSPRSFSGHVECNSDKKRPKTFAQRQKSPLEVWRVSEDKPRKFSTETSCENTSFWPKLHLLYWVKSERYRIPWCFCFFWSFRQVQFSANAYPLSTEKITPLQRLWFLFKLPSIYYDCSSLKLVLFIWFDQLLSQSLYLFSYGKMAANTEAELCFTLSTKVRNGTDWLANHESC